MIVAPESLANTIRDTVHAMVAAERKATPQALLYAEKAGAFQCRTCRYATPVNQTHGKCLVMVGTISLDSGCCISWDADTKQLHLYHEPEADVA